MSSSPVPNSMTEKREVEFVYSDGSREALLVTSIAHSRYRLEESSLLGEAVYGDVVEAEARPDGRLEFIRIAQESDMNTVSCILTPEQMEAPELQALLDRVVESGGNWERALGGVLLVHLPQSVIFDVETEIKTLTSR